MEFLDALDIGLAVAFGLYAAGVATFIVLENRTPQSTFAWLFLFIIFPVGGVLIYLFVGRNLQTFSYKNRLSSQEIGGRLRETLLAHLGDQEQIIEEVAQEKTGDRKKLLELVRRNSHSALTRYNHLEILQNARQKYPRLLEDLRQARHSIHLEYYIWTEDEFTNIVKEILIDRAKAGVEVRCLYDAYGGSGLSSGYLRDLRAAGVAIHPYLRFDSLFKIHSINYRGHRKIAIIDGRIGYLGGMNLDKEQLDGGRYFDLWRDTHLRMVGEAANVLQAIFANSWYNTTKETLEDEIYFPRLAAEIDCLLPIQITTAGPDSQWRAIEQLYFFMILAAKEKVYIQSPFFIPNESIAEGLKAAALAGVDVRVMCAPRGTSYSLPYWAANTYFVEMVRAGVRIFLYQKGYFHPKTINIDSQICSIGTANVDIRSFSIDYEATAVIYDENVARELEEDFMVDLQYCTEFSLEEYQSRNVFLHLRDSLSRLASPLL